ncbi:uncharacterized protein LOC117325012 [Pecten maximus]|uniref:uncharacterized protein LOC117325012 n=1 Tax=Pecten maximus TaxID=6579 RepID=UPI001457F2E2|nr:uncharacterized protein LOC117325012 [Pecten maximus]XP_033736778.1 uncharacterized protein LOC117325012 [Pecten maximus]
MNVSYMIGIFCITSAFYFRLSMVVRKRGMKISRGTGLAVSIIFLGIAVLIALFPKDQRHASQDNSPHIDGFQSCYLSGEWLPVGTNLAVMSVPCIIIIIVSLMSLHNRSLCSGGFVVPTELSFTRNSVSVSPRRMMYVESTSANVIDQSCNASISIYEMRTTSLLPVINTAITIIVIIRLFLIVAARHVQSDETFQTAVLVCFIIQCMVQTVLLLATSFRSRKAIQKSLHLKSLSSNEPEESVPKCQPVTLIPRDNFTYMPEFLKRSSDVDILVEQTRDYSRWAKRVSLPHVSVTSSIYLDIDRTNATARRRMTITVM